MTNLCALEDSSGYSLANMYAYLHQVHTCCGSPAVIAEIHRSYLEQGADIITTASYQVNWRLHLCAVVVELFVC